MGIGRGIAEIGSEIADPLGKDLPVGGLRRAAAGELLDSFPQVPAQPILADLLLIQPDHRERLRQLAVQVEIEQGRDELAPGEITDGAEDHDDGRLQARISVHPQSDLGQDPVIRRLGPRGSALLL